MTSKYRILKKIGEGSYGAIYLASANEDFSTPKHDFYKGEEVALKKFDVNENDGLTPDTVKEVDILNRLHHRNVVSAYDTLFTASTDPSTGIPKGVCNRVDAVLPLAKSDLRDYIKKLPDPLSRTNSQNEEILYIMWQILCGLFYIHTNFIIHNDLKPQNILMFEDENSGKIYPRIADFGLSHIIEGAGDLGIKGFSQSLWWRPPEILKQEETKGMGKAIFSYETDMWALGIIFFEMISGIQLIAGNSISCQLEIIKTTLSQKTAYFGAMYGFRGIFEKMLDANPKTRITAEQALKDPIFDRFECQAKKLEGVPWIISHKITPGHRKMVVEWMRDVCKKLFSSKRNNWQRVFFLAVDVFDRYMSTPKGRDLDKTKYQLVAAASMDLIAKLIVGTPPNLDNFVRMTGDAYKNSQIIGMECKMFKSLNYIIFRPTVQLLFPKTPIDKLVDCYIKNTSPYEVNICATT